MCARARACVCVCVCMYIHKYRYYSFVYYGYVDTTITYLVHTYTSFPCISPDTFSRRYNFRNYIFPNNFFPELHFSAKQYPEHIFPKIYLPEWLFSRKLFFPNNFLPENFSPECSFSPKNFFELCKTKSRSRIYERLILCLTTSAAASSRRLGECKVSASGVLRTFENKNFLIISRYRCYCSAVKLCISSRSVCGRERINFRKKNCLVKNFR